MGELAPLVAMSAPFPGVSAVLQHGEALGLWRFIRLDVPRTLDFPRGSTVILGAWAQGYGQLVDALLLQGCRGGVLWTSRVGEMGFESSEVRAFAQLLQDQRISFIWCGDPVLGGVKLGSGKAFFAPYPVQVEDLRNRSVPKTDSMTLFCPATLKKNLPNQLMAASLLQGRLGLQLHTNVPQDPAWQAIAPIKATWYSWLPQEQYDQVLLRSRLNWAVSYAETFNYQAAEAIMRGVPCVASPTIPFLSRGGLSIVRDVNDAFEIAKVAEAIVADSEAVDLQLELLQDYAMWANAQLKQALRQRGLC